MSKFSVARQPYYIGAAVFAAMSGFTAMVKNSLATGIESDVQLGIVIASAILGLMGLLYLMLSLAGDNDEVDVELGGGVTLHKSWWYLGMLALAIYRAVEGYKHNHDATGAESIYGMIWIVASLLIALLTWANYKSYQRKG